MFRRIIRALRSKAEQDISIYWAGGWSAAIYLLTAFFYRQGFQVPSPTERELFAWFCIMPLLFFFWKGYKSIERLPGQQGVRAVVYFAVLLGLEAFLIFPFHSQDLFVYINTGWQQVHYGQNPYVYVVNQIAAWRLDPMFSNSIWVHAPASYGFLFTLLARGLCRLGNGNWLATIYLFKLVNLAAYGLTAWLVWAGAHRLRLARPLAALYLFAWNPLILMHHIANGHNDILAGCLIALAAYLAVLGAEEGAGSGSSWGVDFWVIPVLAMATLIKDVPAVMIPFAFLFLLKRRGWTITLLSCLATALVAIPASLPYLADWRQFRVAAIVQNITHPEGSLHALLIVLFGLIAKVVPALAPWRGAVNTAIGATLGIGFLIFLAALYVRMGRKLSRIPADEMAGEFIRESLLALTVLLCVAGGRFEPWYLGIILPLALFLEETQWLMRLVVAFTMGEFFGLTFLRSAYVANYVFMMMVPAWIVFEQERRKRIGAESQRAPVPQES